MDTLTHTRPHLTKTGVLDQLLGNTDPNLLLAGIIMAVLGMFVMTRINIAKRDKLSSSTPFEFKLGFFLRDTLPRLASSFITNIAVIAVSIRFMQELMGTGITMFACLLVGMGIDKATIALTDWSNKARK